MSTLPPLVVVQPFTWDGVHYASGDAFTGTLTAGEESALLGRGLVTVDGNGTYGRSVFPLWSTKNKPYDSRLGLYNWHPGNTRKWRTALAKAKQGTSQAVLNCYGDSITWGQFATTPRTDGWVGRLRAKIDADMAASNGSTGVSWLWNTYRTSDPLFSFAGGLSTELPGFGPFDLCGLQSNDNTKFFTFGPTTCDRFTIYYIGQTTGAGFFWSVDGGAETNVSTSGEAGNVYKSVTVSAGALGSHTLKIRTGTTGFFYPIAVEARSGTGGVRTTSVGYPGKNSGDLVTGADVSTNNAHWQYAYNALPPDLSVYTFGSNEYQAQWTVGLFSTKLNALVARSQAYGDVLLVNTVPRNPSGPDPIKQASYYNEAYAVADAFDLPLLDLGHRWGDYTLSSSLYADSPQIHPNNDGYRDIADAVYNAITS